MFLEGGVDEPRKKEEEREFCTRVRGKQHVRTGQEEALVVLGRCLVQDFGPVTSPCLF